MKILIVLTTCIFSLSIIVNAQDDEDWNIRTFDIGEFTEIYLEGGYKVYLSQGDKCELKVKANDDDAFDYLKIKNDPEGLSLKIERKYFNYKRISLYITFKELEKIEVDGGMNLRSRGYLDLNDFFMHVEGGAKIELDLKAEDIQIIGEGGVLVELDGVSNSLDVKLSGAGHVDADNLKAKDVTFKIEGVGTGSVHAVETLFAKIEGVGKVKYHGNPRVTKDIEGLGSVTKD